MRTYMAVKAAALLNTSCGAAWMSSAAARTAADAPTNDCKRRKRRGGDLGDVQHLPLRHSPAPCRLPARRPKDSPQDLAAVPKAVRTFPPSLSMPSILYVFKKKFGLIPPPAPTGIT